MSTPAAFTNSLAAFFDRHPLAETATYTTSSGATAQIKVHFINSPKQMALVQEQYNGAEAFAWCKSSDMASATRGDTLKVRGTTWQFLEVEQDDSGTTKVILSSVVQHG